MYMQTTLKKQGEENFIAQSVTRYLPYWPLFLLLMVLTLDAAWGYLYVTNPLYESTARILIKDEKKGTEDSKGLEELNQISTKKIIENEMDVIQSRTLLDEVALNLGLSIPVTAEERFRKHPAYSSSPVRIQAAGNRPSGIPPKIYFTYNTANSTVNIQQGAYPLDQWVATPFGRFRFIRNPRFTGTQAGTKLFFQVLDPVAVVAAVQERLKVSTSSKQSSVLILSLRDEVPARGEDILNGLLSVYNKAMLSDKNMLASNTLSSVETRLRSVEHDLDSIEHKAQLYKSRKGVVDIGEQGKIFLQSVSENDRKMGDVSLQLAILDEAEKSIKDNNQAGGFVPSTAGINDPELPKLIEKLNNYELEKETLKKTAGENNFAMTSITDRIEKLKPSIIESINNQRRSLQASSKNIELANRSYSSQLESMPEKERDLVEINRELSIKNSIYAFLLQKREEAALSHASTVSDSRIIDLAQSSASPVTPKPKVIYLSAFLLALITGAGLVTLRESFSRKIMFRQEIQRLSTCPIIGEISAHGSRTPVVIGTQQRTFIAEQFRKLRSSLQFIGITGRRKRLMVTSSVSGEGKSFVSLNLAISLALTGKKVVLVDADLHNPSLHTKLNLEQQAGLAEFLLGEADEHQIVTKSDLHPNLFFIAAGRLPENPSELLMLDQMEDLLNELDTKFDYIVVDTAPVGLVSDAYALSPYCDATLFVVRHNYTPKSVVQQMDEENKINHLENIGIVFNDVHTRGFGDKYGYGYGSGYLYNDRKYHRLNKAN